jgi:hypothetical protein
MLGNLNLDRPRCWLLSGNPPGCPRSGAVPLVVRLPAHVAQEILNKQDYICLESVLRGLNLQAFPVISVINPNDLLQSQKDEIRRINEEELDSAIVVMLKEDGNTPRLNIERHFEKSRGGIKILDAITIVALSVFATRALMFLGGQLYSNRSSS